jgi:hypothetical protein
MGRRAFPEAVFDVAPPEPGEAAGGGFAVGGLQVAAGAVHHFDHVVEADEVAAVGQEGEGGALDGAQGGVHVAFDAGDLHVAFDGVAGEAEVVFHGHFGGVLDLVERGAESWAAAAAAIEQAEPISAWQPASAPETVALARMEEPNRPAVARASRMLRGGRRRAVLKK